MRRGNGFVRVFSGMMLALILVLGVCGGVWAEETKASSKATPEQINKIERKLFSIESDITEIKNFQVNNSGQMWFERTKEQAEHVREWVDEKKISSEKWANTLSVISSFMGAWVTVFGIAVTVLGYFIVKQQKNTAKEASEAFEKELSQTKAEFKRNAKEQKETIETDKKEFEKKLEELITEKHAEINELVKKCEELKLICEKNACKSDELLSEQEQTVKDFKDNHDAHDMDNDTKEAVKDVASSKPNELYTHLKAKALRHEMNEEWDKAILIWTSIEQEFPNNKDANYKIGSLTWNIAEKESNITAKQKLLDIADNSLKKASLITPSDPYVWNNWGWIKYQKGLQLEEDKRNHYFSLALDKYQKAIELGNNSYAWSNKAALLSNKAQLPPYSINSPSKDLLSEAKDAASHATPYETKRGCYALATVAAMEKNQSECIKWLELGKTNPKFPNSESLQKDKLFETVRNEQWFKDFLEELRQEEQEAAAKQAESDEDKDNA
ncbi:tetratricopeptide repeat protein [Desulfovibrio sp. JC022]|uniref:tetratricopeptide repeat protein n=1 Tax=Desulfovibrio sp. JC022 TaxID=2593642 RepID=UPI0013D6F42A|nr:hypothetical protein [Desulfovibrio sp. JC022]NDV23192.1 hypothetical protein [Desulfovibrio sp. JC022]